MVVNHLLIQLFLLITTVINSMSCTSLSTKQVISARITKTWNNQTIPFKDQISISFNYSPNSDLQIHLYAPFYDDPKLPDWSKKPGYFDKLWDYEVVELFLLNSLTEEYLEIELGPRGQYLLLQLKGYRNVTRDHIELKSYFAKLHLSNPKRKSWSAMAIVSKDDLPKDFDRFNAYAIHGTGDEERKYLSLFPAPENSTEYSKPDFHRLELFGKISDFLNYHSQ